jgi:hypothetical protein
VNDFAELILQSRYQFGVIVSQGIDCNATQCIQVHRAIDVPQAAALTVADGDGQAAIGVHGVRRTGFNECGHIAGSLQMKLAQGKGRWYEILGAENTCQVFYKIQFFCTAALRRSLMHAHVPL